MSKDGADVTENKSPKQDSETSLHPLNPQEQLRANLKGHNAFLLHVFETVATSQSFTSTLDNFRQVLISSKNYRNEIT